MKVRRSDGEDIMIKRPGPGEKYRHFKGGIYQVVTVAKHSERGEELVVYQALYGDYAVYAKPLAMFAKEFVPDKYPRLNADSMPGVEHVDESGKKQEEKEQSGETVSGVDPKLMEFLETDSLEERYNILVSMRDIVTDGMIDTMAVVMDTVIPEGEIMKRYDDLKHVIQTRQQYENANRLR